MADTKRQNYRGEPMSDGEHAKRCPETNCNYCVNGKAKRVERRKVRHDWKPEDD